MKPQKNIEDVQADPAVLARNKYHKFTVKLCALWLVPLHVFFATFGLIFVLAPAVFKKWGVIVNGLPVVSFIFDQCSTIGWLFWLWIVTIYTIKQIEFFIVDYPKTKHLSQDKRAEYEFFRQDDKEIIAKSLYPKSKKEEFHFWIKMISKIVEPTYFPALMSPLAFIIKSGGYAT